MLVVNVLLQTLCKADEVLTTIESISKILPENPVHQRIFKYNSAHSFFGLKQYEATIEETYELIQEYYVVLGISPEDIIGKNADKIRPLLKKKKDTPDNLKHLADSLYLYAQAMNASELDSQLARIHTMKFYELPHALDTLIRVGQDLVDDFIGARQIIETNLLPSILRFKLTSRIIPVRSQYAVILAYCGDFNAANAEMARLASYEAGLDEKGQWELANQRQLIANIERAGSPKQWVSKCTPSIPILVANVGRNAPCPCESRKKYKKCCGNNM